MCLDNGVNALTTLYAEHLAKRMGVSQDDLSKQNVQYIIDLVNNQPKYDDHDLETKNVTYHQKKHGHCKVPQRFEPNPSLGSGVAI